jgi:murein DD-endopeptidase MepM/ murein hydrolase activator NlpD
VHSRLAIIFVLATGAALTSDAAMPNRDDYAYAWPVGPGCKQRLERNPNFGNNLRLRANGTTRPHLGVDLIPPEDDLNIYAAAPGVVAVNSPARGSGWGNYVVVRHDDGIRTRYGHLVTPSPLAVDSTVAQGDVIGIAGQTETSYVHVHFEVESPAQREAWAKGRIDPVSVAGPLRRCRNSAAPR